MPQRLMQPRIRLENKCPVGLPWSSALVNYSARSESQPTDPYRQRFIFPRFFLANGVHGAWDHGYPLPYTHWVQLKLPHTDSLMTY